VKDDFLCIPAAGAALQPEKCRLIFMNIVAKKPLGQSMKIIKTAFCALIVLPILAAGAQAATPKPPIPPTTGLALWLKADVGLAADGSSWLDQSGNSHDATALNGKAPTVVAGGLKGLPVAVFNGGQAMSIAGSVLSSQQFTIIVVATDTGAPGHGFQETISNWDGNNADTSVFLGTTEDPMGKTKFVDRIRFTDAVGGADQGQQGQGKISKPAVPFTFTGVSSSTDATIYLASKLEYDLTTPLPTRDLTFPWFIGQQGSSPFEAWNGDIAEILVYNRVLTTVEFKQTLAYLHKKWE
jgi:hypothetical protein